MYLAIDIGGTKTLMAAFTTAGKLVATHKFPTPADYQEFLAKLHNDLSELGDYSYHAGGVGVPGELDRQHGRLIALGNLPWEHEEIQRDIERITHCPIIIENDAKLAALSEAFLLRKKYGRTLYVTFSTGIGIGLIVNGRIDTHIGDLGGRGIMLEHHGRVVPWESFASGKAIVKKYGKRASDINDKATWKAIVRDMAVGLIDLLAILEPEVVVIGGGVGTNFHKFGEFLVERLKGFETPMMKIPPFRSAERPEQAVAYGAYELAMQKYGHLTR